MAKVTWLGKEGSADTILNFKGVLFKKGEEVDLPKDFPWLSLLKDNKAFKVEEEHSRPHHHEKVEAAAGEAKGESAPSPRTKGKP